MTNTSRDVETHQKLRPALTRYLSSNVLAKIQRGDPGFQRMVPAEVSELIRARGAFGWRERLSAAS